MTSTPELNVWFSAAFALFLGALLVVEIIGIRRRSKGGDTLTENWRWIEAWLPDSAAWVFRVFTGGLLIWAVLHFLVGAD